MTSASYCPEYGVSLVYALSTKRGILAGRGVIIFASLVFILHYKIRLNCPGDVVSNSERGVLQKRTGFALSGPRAAVNW